MNSTEIYDSARRVSPALQEFNQLIRYRDLVAQLIARNVKIRYKRSFLGVAWTMLNPLLTMVILTLVFANIFRFSVESYPTYLLSGLIIWNFFAQSTSDAMGELIYSGQLFNRIYVPKAVFAVASVGNGLLNLIFSIVPLLIIMIVTKVPIHPTILLLPLPISITAIFTLGVGLLLSTAALYFADTLVIYQVLLTAWMYLTPIIYPLEIVPKNILFLIKLNPMYFMVDMFRALLYQGALPEMKVVIIAAVFALGTFALGWWIFTRQAHEYPYRA